MLVKELEKRLKVFGIIAIIAFCLLTTRLGYLQIIKGEEYKDLAEGNRIRLIPQPAPRGLVFDRNGVLLIGNRPAFSVSVMQITSKEDFENTLLKLGEILGITKEEIDERIKQQNRRSFEPIKIATDVDLTTITKIEEQKVGLTGVIIDTEPIRYYPYKDLATHVLGYVGEINAKELEKKKQEGKDYQIGDIIGKMGIEQCLDEELKGVRGGKRVEVDVKGNLISTQGEVIPTPGNQVKLTIDLKVQQAAENGLVEIMDTISRQYPNAKTGAVVAMDVNTGEILALASKPGFDLNLFAGRMTPEQLNEINNNPLKPYNNRAISSAYPPGSTFKPITALAGLRKGTVTPNEYFYDSGVYYVGRHPFRCWKRTGHGSVNLVDGLKHSCNIVFYEIAMRTGIDDIAVMAREFGLGEKTGIILPGEAQGIVPDTKWKEEAYKKGITRYATWFKGDTANAAIGQGDHLYTPIQLVRMTAAIANGGKVFEPQLVSAIIDNNGQETFRMSPKIVKQASVSQEHLAIIRQGMKAVTSEGGTAGSAFRGFPIQVAGKTGTAQNAHGDNHAWFVGYAPADNPQIAVAVLVEQGGSGSTAAAPVARRVFEAFFNIQSDQAELNLDFNAVE
ncbi:MAG TPA: penicillin-binding protein 2 [Clostridia bacterium]|nr:penicillin-binding protein 2 [Clostridia bacterium]